MPLIRTTGQPPPPRLPPVRTPPGGKVASQSWSPPACWSSLLQGPQRRNSCRRKLTTRARSPPPLPHRPSPIGVAPWWPPLLETPCPPRLTALRTRTLSWAPVLTVRETMPLPSPPPPALCPARAGSLVLFTRLLLLSSWLPNSCRAHPLESHLAAPQRRAGLGVTASELAATVTQTS